MRFKEIKKFKPDELLLDKGNYRFQAADNQKACIQKIYALNPQNFRNMMESVAKDDLGELLLVYKSSKGNIVMDGNRRTAALKVLADPKLAPSDAIRQYAEELRKDNPASLKDIQGNISSDKGLIYKTVYERHAAGHGKSRINWSAYGAARFRFDEKMETGTDWYAIALLLEAEQQDAKWTDFIEGAYSHEVFRRIIRAAIEKGVISESIFSQRDQRIKKAVDKALLKDALFKVHKFLEAMASKNISLSRADGKYADKSAVDDFVMSFGLSPDNKRIEEAKRKSANDPKPSSDPKKQDAPDDGKSQPDGAKGGQPSPDDDTKSKNLGVKKSNDLEKALNRLGSRKLTSLYTSLCNVSRIQHPQLLYVGAWSFFECFAAILGKGEAEFTGFFNGKMNELGVAAGYTKQKKKDFAEHLGDIASKGNATKHSPKSFVTTAEQLVVDFEVLEPLIVDMIDRFLSDKKASA